MIPLIKEKLHEFLISKGLKAEIQQETGQVFVLCEIAGREYPIFFRCDKDNNLLQLLAFLPCALQQAAISDTARLLHYLNRELDVPGFGMDEKAGLIFFRIMLPCTQEGADPEILESLVSTCKTVAESFTPVLAAVASGLNSLDEILSKIQEPSTPI